MLKRTFCNLFCDVWYVHLINFFRFLDILLNFLYIIIVPNPISSSNNNLSLVVRRLMLMQDAFTWVISYRAYLKRKIKGFLLILGNLDGSFGKKSVNWVSKVIGNQFSCFLIQREHTNSCTTNLFIFLYGFT